MNAQGINQLIILGVGQSSLVYVHCLLKLVSIGMCYEQTVAKFPSLTTFAANLSQKLAYLATA
jgi:hypothetical protein